MSTSPLAPASTRPEPPTFPRLDPLETDSLPSPAPVENTESAEISEAIETPGAETRLAEAPGADEARAALLSALIAQLPPGSSPDEAFAEVARQGRSEEHTSELQSHSFISYAVFCLKKKNGKSS